MALSEIPKSNPQRGPSRRRILQGLLATIATVSTAVAYNTHIPDAEPVQAEPIMPEPVNVETNPYQTLRDIFQEETFSGPNHTAQRFEALIDIFDQFTRKRKEIFSYYTLDGEIVFEAAKPENWHAKTEDEKQKWHNQNRLNSDARQLHTPSSYAASGYPLVGVPYFVKKVKDQLQEADAVKELNERLNKEHQDSRYFDGKNTSLRDAIRKLTKAYNVPYAIAIGLAAYESGFRKKEKSKKKAQGIFQFLKKTSDDDAKRYLRDTEHRAGGIGTFKKEITNNFAQTELFCAEYNFLKKAAAESIEKLSNRIKEVDPDFNTGLETLIVVNAYYSGIGNIINAINAFCEKSDDEIKARIGEAPYGFDLWLGVVGDSFSQNSIGPHGFFYPAHVFAMAKILVPETDLLAGQRTPRPQAPEAISTEPEPEPSPEPSPLNLALISKATAITSITAITSLLIEDLVKKRPKLPTIDGLIFTRREIIAITLGLSLGVAPLSFLAGAAARYALDDQIQTEQVETDEESKE